VGVTSQLRLFRRKARRGCAGTEAGFVAIDALVGLSILASVLALAMASSVTALRIGIRSVEIDRARTELISLVQSSGSVPGLRSGETEEFTWSVHMSKAAFDPKGDLCRLEVQLSGKTSPARYRLTTLRPCRQRPTDG
jgi:hypothetical protein